MDIKYTYKVTGNGKEVQKAETERFSWWFGQDSYLHDKLVNANIYQMSYGWESPHKITDDTIKLAREFWDTLSKEQDRVKKEQEEIEMEAIRKEELEMRTRPFNAKKAKQYDNIMNEGGEGYNPYR
jgi:hypothetical protein